MTAEGMTNAEVKQLGKLADGMYVTSAYLEDPAFEQRYKSKFGLSRVELNLAHVALGHEIAKFFNAGVVELSKQGRDTSINNLRTVLSTIRVEGALGAISFEGRKTIARQQVILVARDGNLSRAPGA